MTDPSILDELHRQYNAKINRFFLRHLLPGSYEDAEDLTQEVLFKAWLNYEDLNTMETRDGWIFKIANNRLIDFIRRAQRVPMSSLEDHISPDIKEGDRWVDTIEDTSRVYSPVAQAVKEETIQDIRRVLKYLSPEHREIIKLRYFLDLDIKTTAKVLGIKEGTVKSRFSRACDVMRMRLQSSFN